MRSSSPLPTAALSLIATAVTLSLACGAGNNDSPDETGVPVADLPDASRSGTDGAIGNATGSNPPDGATTTVPQDTGPPAVRFIGRFETAGGAQPSCAWPGCRIIASFTGTTELKVRLDEHVEPWMEGGPSQWDVSIDGVLQPKLVLELGEHDYVLASGLGNGPHRVELYKRTEAQNGYTRFLGYDFGGGSLLPPPARATRHIEFIGDSGPAGFGIEGVGLGPDCPGVDWSSQWQNFHKSMVSLLGESLSAEMHGTVYSGKGLVRNIYRTDPNTMPVIYARANPLFPTSSFDFDTFVPDVFVMMMGGNDFAIGQPFDNGPTPPAEFTQAARDLVAVFRSRSAQAHIFLALSPSVRDDAPEGRASRTNVQTAFDTVASERQAAGDPHIYSVAPPLAVPSELTGCNGHGTPAYHVRVASQLGAMIKVKTGW
jgi:lysophospholipase L1-like esterase